MLILGGYIFSMSPNVCQKGEQLDIIIDFAVQASVNR